MAGSRKHKKGSRKGKKGSQKKSSKASKQQQQQLADPVNVASSGDENDDFKDMPDIDLDLVDANRVFPPTPRAGNGQGFAAQEQHDEKCFREQTYSSRTEITVQSATESGAEIFSCAYNEDTTLIAAGCGDGSVRVYNTGGKLTAAFNAPNADLPVTALKFRPAGLSTTKNILTACGADGTLAQWHVMSKTCIFSLTEEANQIYSVEYNPDGSVFTTAGRDAAIRVYDEATKTLVSSLASGRTSGTPGHSNRIYSVKFVPGQPDVVVSGGWDSTVLVWDLRTGVSVRSFYGPHICGDAVDVDPSGSTIVTASWRPDQALELWDLRSCKKLRDIDWQLKVTGKSRPEMLYGAKFSPDGSMLLAGGCGTKDARIINTTTFSLVDCVSLADKGVYAVDISSDNRQLCVAGGGLTLVDL